MSREKKENISRYGITKATKKHHKMTTATFWHRLQGRPCNRLKGRRVKFHLGYNSDQRILHLGDISVLELNYIGGLWYQFYVNSWILQIPVFHVFQVFHSQGTKHGDPWTWHVLDGILRMPDRRSLMILQVSYVPYVPCSTCSTCSTCYTNKHLVNVPSKSIVSKSPQTVVITNKKDSLVGLVIDSKISLSPL